MSERQKVSFDKSAVFRKDNNHYRNIETYRDDLFRKFSRNMTSLLESNRPKRFSSNKGLLDTRKLYRHSFDDNVFYKKTSTPHSDTTFLFLVDASGSMSSNVLEYNDNYIDRIEMCGAITSAFAKANKTVLNNKIKMEVFTKTEGSTIMNGFVKGYVPILSRVFSNVTGDTDWDKLIRLNTSAPVKVDGREDGSYTPEFLLLPTLMEWCRKNITTRNMVIINLTDGEVVHCFLDKETITDEDTQGNGYSRRTGTRARNTDTKSLRIKYLRGIPNTTLFMGNGGEYYQNQMKDIYGTNAVCADGEDFEGEFFKVLNNLLKDEYNA